MAQSFLLFDFGSDEEAAQRARHMVDGWKQAFRLDKKLLLKFAREEDEKSDSSDSEKSDSKDADSSKDAHIRLMVRLDFSDHERLSHQRWLDRIPGEAHFKGAHPKVIRQGDTEFSATAERFDGLE
jgi:hypothetical protein